MILFYVFVVIPLTFALAYLLLVVAGWYVIGRDVPVLWVVTGILLGGAMAHPLELQSPDWLALVELRHFLGAGVGGIVAAVSYVLLRRGGVTS